MFGRLCTVVVVATLVNALTLNVPSNIQSSTSFQLTWTAAAGDPPIFSVYLNHPTFNNVLGVANDLNTNDGNATINLPAVTAQSGYTLEAVAFNNVSDVLSQTSSFSIAAASSSTTSRTSTSSAGSGTSSGSSSSSGSSGSITNTASSASGTSTSPASSQSGNATTSGTGSQSSTGNAATAVKFGFNGAAVAAVTLAMMAGAAIVAF